MGMLIWIAMAVALWHFAIFFPDRFWGGIVGSLLLAVFGAALITWIISGFTIPGNSEVTITTALIAIPGAVIGLIVSYLIGVKRGNQALELE